MAAASPESRQDSLALALCSCCRSKRPLACFSESRPDKNDANVVKLYSTCASCRVDKKARKSDDRVTCECGKSVMRRMMKPHLATKIHTFLIEQRHQSSKVVQFERSRTPRVPPGPSSRAVPYPPVEPVTPRSAADEDQYHYNAVRSVANAIRDRPNRAPPAGLGTSRPTGPELPWSGAGALPRPPTALPKDPGAEPRPTALSAEVRASYGLPPRLIELQQRVANATRQ